MSTDGDQSKWQQNFAQRQPLSSALASLAREMVKDVRGTMNEVFFGQPEHASEPGTPLNPTQMIVTEEMSPEPDMDI